jgi:hypothetical protein
MLASSNRRIAMGLNLAKFDASKNFVTAAAFRAAGKPWGKGFPFDKESIDERTLRLLYEQRKLVYADSPEAQKLVRQPSARPEVAPAMSAAERQKAQAAATSANESEAKLVEKLTAANTKAELLAKARGLAGVDAKDNKTAIATVLVRHGIIV